MVCRAFDAAHSKRAGALVALGPHAFFLVAGGRAAAPPGCALGESTLPGWTRWTWARALALREAAPARAPARAASVAAWEDATLAVQDAAQLPYAAPLLAQHPVLPHLAMLAVLEDHPVRK